MKKVVLFLIGLFLFETALCKNDYDTAKRFMLKKGIKLSTDTVGCNKSGDFKIFKGANGIGYAVVKNDTIIAYSTEETGDKFIFSARTRGYELTPKTPIEPMIKAKYAQFGTPYTDSLPNNSPVGCGALAVAEIMYYYKNEKCNGTDMVVFDSIYPTLKALPPTHFNWDNILPEYLAGTYNKEQAAEIAKLMKYVGYAIHSTYTKYSTGSWLRPQWLNNLGFSNKTYSTVGDEFQIGTFDWWRSYSDWRISDLELEELLDNELEQGRPVLVGGYNKDISAGHWQIVDGRDDTGRYHVKDAGYVIVSQEMYINDDMSYGVMGMINKLWCVIPIVEKTGNSIKNVHINKETCVYDINGNKVGNTLNSLKKGIYIVNGKKHIVK